MKGFKSSIEKDALKNTNFRKVLYTSKHLQVVLMSLKPGEEIGAEIHKTIDQFFRLKVVRANALLMEMNIRWKTATRLLYLPVLSIM